MVIKNTLKALSAIKNKLSLFGRIFSSPTSEGPETVPARTDRLFFNLAPVFTLPLRRRRRFSIKDVLKNPISMMMGMIFAFTLFAGPAFAARWQVNSVTGIGAQGGTANYGTAGAATFVITYTHTSVAGAQTNDNLTMVWTGTVPVGVTMTPATFTQGAGTTVTVTFNTTAATTQIGSYPFQITITDTNGGAG